MKHAKTAILPFAAAVALSATQLNAVDSAEVSVEVLDSDLFNIQLFSAQNELTQGPWEIRTTVSRSDYDIDFQPVSFDLLGIETQIREKTYSLSVAASRDIRENLSLDLGAGYRDGFPSYRAVWLDTYFDQHFSPLEGVPGHELYEDFQPSAASFNAGLTWEYIPANAVASVTISRIQDNVSPGYEIDFDGITRSETVLATTSLSLVTENVLTQRLRSRFAVSASETSAREIRYSAELALNAALGERFVWKNRVGAATENPRFDAYFFETTLDYQFNEKTAVYVQGRRYNDTGEIENAFLFTSAAPELDNDSVGLGFRYTNDNWSAKVSAKHSTSDFAATNANTDFFQNLYIDSDWLSLQVAIGKAF